jgi:acetyl/propionyl-CoA carboxylase alpha subunit
MRDGAGREDRGQREGGLIFSIGYGFLSENASFAARCEKEGITFVGPSADSVFYF